MVKKVSMMLLVFVTAFVGFAGVSFAKADEYRVAWTHYTGWEPWEYARESGILKKWADKYGIAIELVLVPDYIESINQYTAGVYDGCVMTNMDALTIPAVGGVDSTALIIGDFSNGNDGVVLVNGNEVRDLKGRKILIVELSVSHYLLARALGKYGLTERDVSLVNTSDSDIASAFEADRNPKAAVVTWNPPLMQVRNKKSATMVFDSSQIPGEIIDMTVVRTDAPDTLKKALVGAWYETMAVMSSRGKQAEDAIAYMAKFAGGTVAEFKSQLKTTAMFYQATDAVAFAKGNDLKKTMEYVRSFSFDHGLYEKAPTKDFVGIAFPDGSVMGDKKNVKLRFDAKYMDMATKGQL